jgi:hypothetical protein
MSCGAEGWARSTPTSDSISALSCSGHGAEVFTSTLNTGTLNTGTLPTGKRPGAQSNRPRMSSASSVVPNASPSSMTLVNSSALRALSAMTFSSMVPAAMSR